MVLGGTPTEWATLAALVLGPGLIATLVWSPVLVPGRLRALFRSLPLTGHTAVNYVVASLALSVPWLVGLAGGLAELGSQVDTGQATGEPVMDVAVQLSGLYLVALPVAAGAGLPHLGVDWDPHGYEPMTWVLLVGASGWYAAIFAVPAFLFALIASLPG